MPLLTIRQAHKAKIYGLDWSRHSEYEITSCSLDQTIKNWDVSQDTKEEQLLCTIVTEYPVWRARTLPFGRGVLAQPHRGHYKLDMYRFDDPGKPAHTFEGLTGIVKEYVWSFVEGMMKVAVRSLSIISIPLLKLIPRRP